MASSEHWPTLGERGSVLGMRVLFAAYRVLGRWAFTLLLYPVAAYFCIVARSARRASRDYLCRVHARLMLSAGSPRARLSTFRHVLAFGNAILDKVAMWAGVFPPEGIEYDNPEVLSRFQEGSGALFIGSHLGNLEVLRAYGGAARGFKVNALMFTRHSPKFNRMMSAISPRALDGVIQVDSLGPDAILLLQDKLRAGEHVAIVGDRVSVHHQERSIRVPFLGTPAPFPEGPFILASLLACPVYLLFCLRIGSKYRVFVEPFADPLKLPRSDRKVALRSAIDQYAQRLETHCLMAPLQWFNFFDFWELANSPAPERVT